MSTFAFERIEAVVGKQQFDKLVVDGHAPFDEFEENIEEQYKSEMMRIYACMKYMEWRDAYEKGTYGAEGAHAGQIRRF